MLSISVKYGEIFTTLESVFVENISPCLTEIDSKLYITSLPEFYAYFWLSRSGLVVVNFLVLQVLYRGIIEKRLCKENSLVVARVASVEWSSCGE